MQLKQEKTRILVPIESILPSINLKNLLSSEATNYDPETTGDPILGNGITGDVDGMLKNVADAIYDSVINFPERTDIYFNNKFKDWLGLNDQIVVDIGSGPGLGGYELARLAGAKSYIGVDKYHADKLKLKLLNYEKAPKLYPAKLSVPIIPAATIAGDMLQILKRFPNDSVSITAGTIDHHVIPNLDYLREVSFEIERVLHLVGVFINYGSDLGSSKLEYELPPNEYPGFVSKGRKHKE